VKARTTARFALALAVVSALVQLGLSRVITLGAHGGVAGITAALIVAGFFGALVFTVVYDGPRSVRSVLKGGSAPPEV
jgi:membrane associated rhomboid family serine protease